MIISRCHQQSKEGQAYSDSFKGKKIFLTLWNWNSRIESIFLKFDSWLLAICKPQQPSSNKWPWMEQLKCYILKLIVTILPPKKITLSSSNSLSCMYSSRCMLCVCVCGFFFLPDVIFMSCFLDLRILGNLRKHQCKARHRGFDEFGYLFLSLIKIIWLRNTQITSNNLFWNNCFFIHLASFCKFFQMVLQNSHLIYSLLLLWSCYILCNWI